MKRLFTFGCSFTNYCWPTWADILSLDYDEYYNYARPGAGNQFIFEQVCEADITHHFTKDDQIIIMWSTYHRHDLFKDDKWELAGNILNAKPLYDEEYIRKYFDIKGSVLHSLNYILATQRFLSHTNWKMASMLSMTMPIGENISLVDKMFHHFQNRSIFTEFPDLQKYAFIFDHENWIDLPLGQFSDSFTRYAFFHVQHDPQQKPQWDSHPTPSMHVEWLQKVGFDVKLKEADKLIAKWYHKFGDQPFIHRKNSMMWCKENIDHKLRY